MSEQYNALYARSKSRHRVALNAGPSKQASTELMASVEAAPCSSCGGGEGDGDGEGDGGDGRGVIRIAGLSPESELRGERGRVSERFVVVRVRTARPPDDQCTHRIANVVVWNSEIAATAVLKPILSYLASSAD